MKGLQVAQAVKALVTASLATSLAADADLHPAKIGVVDGQIVAHKTDPAADRAVGVTAAVVAALDSVFDEVGEFAFDVFAAIFLQCLVDRFHHDLPPARSRRMASI